MARPDPRAHAPLTAPAAPQAVVGADAEFSEIVRAQTAYVWRVLRCLGVREADLDDLCQDTFMVVHRKLPTFEQRSALRTWIYGIARRLVSDYRQRAHRTRERLVSTPPEHASTAHPEQALQLREDWALLDKLMDGLAEEQRMVFMLYEVEQLTMREVSEIVGCPVQTAYSRLHIARKRIADTLEQLNAQESEP
jgi:RNA polymerase sigma-70 factor, ECF subfamily